MKLKKSCYDPAFCRMGFKRFAPIGMLYALVMALMTLAYINMGQKLSSNVVYSMYTLLQYTAVCQFAYAFVLTQLLLGDLYTPRLCYAIHSLPVTRGGWFGTQVIQGILSILPGILLSGGLMSLSMTRFRVLIPLWMGISLLQFLFFFGLALLCGVSAGNRMGMALLYGLANFFGVVISWSRLKIFAPLIYGMYMPDTDVVFCPLSTMLSKELISWDTVQHYHYPSEDSPTAFFDSNEITSLDIHSEGILTFLLFAGLGILAIFLAMKLLNRRKPECAGDLLAFRKTEPVVLVLCTLSAAVVFHAISSLFDWSMGYLMLAVGLVLGYYVCLMLLKRQVNVFSGKSFLPLGILGGLVLLSLTATGLDVFGAVYRLPEAAQVQEVSLRVPGSYHDTFTATEEEDIQNLLTLQQGILEEHRQRENARPLAERIFGNEETHLEYYKEDGDQERASQMFLIYTMKDGSTLCRSYPLHESMANLEVLQNIYSQPEFVYSDFNQNVFSLEDVRKLLEKTEFIQLNCWHDVEYQYYYLNQHNVRIPKEEWDSLLEAMLADGEEGHMAQSAVFHPGSNYHDTLTLYYPAVFYEGMDYQSISLFEDCTHTLTWLVEHGYHDPITQ